MKKKFRDLYKILVFFHKLTKLVRKNK